MNLKLSYAISCQKTSFTAIGSDEIPLEEKAALLSSLGFQGIELAIRNPADVNLGSLIPVLTKYNLVVPTIGTGQAYVDEGLSLSSLDPEIRRAALNRMGQHLTLAKELGSMVTIGLIRGGLDSKNPTNSKELFKDSLLHCLDQAGHNDVKLLLEPLNRYECSFLNSLEEAKQFVDQIGSPYLRLLADVFHMNIEDTDICESLRSSGSRISHVHFADSNRRFPGAGHLNFDQIVASLQGLGYSGFVSGEMLPLPTEDQAIRTFYTFMEKYRG